VLHYGSKTLLRRGLLCVAVAVCFEQGADLIGAQRLHHYEQESALLVSQQREHLRRTARVVVSGDVVDQNAAAWYELAFARLKSVPSETRKELSVAVDSRQESDSTEKQALVDRRCSEASSARIKIALRCNRCDWGIGYRLEDSRDWEHGNEALVLGYCGILNGQLLAKGGHRDEAVQSLTGVLSFGSDLANGDLAMNIAGLMFWKLSLRELDTFIDHDVVDRRFLTTLDNLLSKFKDNVPGIRQGLDFETLWVATGLTNEAQRYVGAHRIGLGHLVPWRGIAAWRLSEDWRIVEALHHASTLTDSEQRVTLAEKLREQLQTTPSSWLRKEVPLDAWLRFAEEADRVGLSYASLQIAARLEVWYATHRQYPSQVRSLGDSIDLRGLRYEATDQGAGYKLTGRVDGRESIVREQRAKYP
jgi:hypothetical protein